MHTSVAIPIRQEVLSRKQMQAWRDAEALAQRIARDEGIDGGSRAVFERVVTLLTVEAFFGIRQRADILPTELLDNVRQRLEQPETYRARVRRSETLSAGLGSFVGAIAR